MVLHGILLRSERGWVRWSFKAYIPFLSLFRGQVPNFGRFAGRVDFQKLVEYGAERHGENSIELKSVDELSARLSACFSRHSTESSSPIIRGASSESRPQFPMLRGHTLSNHH